MVNLTFSAAVTGGDITSHPDDPRVEAVDLIEQDRLLSLDLRPPIAPFILETLASPEARPLAYLGPLFTAGKGVTPPAV